MTDYFYDTLMDCGLKPLNGLEFFKEKALNCIGQCVQKPCLWHRHNYCYSLLTGVIADSDFHCCFYYCYLPPNISLCFFSPFRPVS